jgi:nucleotide-binding universal stress UspA family protein
MLAPGQPWPVEEMLADAEEDLRAQVRAGAAHAVIPVEFVTARGEPFGQLSRIATELRADAVVVGASTRAGHRIVGSLGVRLVRAGRWPVVIVP